MTMTSLGFNGSVNDIGWSRLGRLLGNPPCTERVGDLPIVQVTGQRQIKLGTNVRDTGAVKRSAIWGDGILTSLDADEYFTLPTPTNTGNWYLVVLTRSWGNSTVVWNARTGPSTPAGAAGYEVPDTYPATTLAAPGTQSDVPVCWVWQTTQSTDLVIVPILAPGRHLGRSGTTAERNAMFAQLLPTVGSAFFTNAVQAQLQVPKSAGEWFNTETLCVERYNPGMLRYAGGGEVTIGQGDIAAGWYPVAGMLPAVVADSSIGNRPPTFNVTSGPLTPTAITFYGSNTQVNRGFSYDPGVGTFTCKYTGRYRFGGTFRHSSGPGADVRLYLQQLPNGSRGGTDGATIGIIGGAATNIGVGGTFPDIYMQAGDKVVIGINNGTGSTIGIAATQRMVSAQYLGA
jgi:hypothetical protein